MNEVILQAKDLQKEFRVDGNHVNIIIPNLNLDIIKGEFVVIMGNSGSGKSTLLYLLGGLDNATQGEILVKGQNLPATEKKKTLFRRSTLGVIFQQNNLIPSLTLLENVLVSAFLIQKNRKKARLKAIQLLKELDIEKLQDRYPSQVSGGEQQRCAIARGLVNAPDILLADEPTGSLNSAATEKVLETFSSLHKNGQTIIMVTHEIEAACYGERIVYLRDGEIVDEYRMNKNENKRQKEKALLGWLTEKGW